MKNQIYFVIVFVFGLLMQLNAQNTIDNAFFEKVPYSGAFGQTDWTKGWANFNPQTTSYPATTITVNAGDITSNTTWSASNSPLSTAASFADAYLTNSFFEPVSFAGAFGPIDWTAGWSNFNPQTTTYPVTTVTVEAGDITTNTTWTSGNVYKLNGYVYVKAGVTLTIEPGTVIRGDKVNKGTLIIERGAKLNAIGTVSQPIVFTSNQAAGSRDYGDWGGVIICGKAKNNQGSDVLIEGGVNAYYGGNIDNDNSGTLKYVRIEFPGIAFSPNNEINGLTMGSVGSGTTLDYIQVSYSGDDAYEWFGGKVNAKHLIAYRAWDDDFDTDFGFTGMIQFGVVLRDPNVADVSGSNGFESDNDANGSTLTPKTKPVFSNISVFGPKATSGTTINSDFKRAMHIRRNSACSIFNSVFAGYPTGLFLDATATQTNATNDELKIENTFLVGMTTNFASTFEDTYFNTPSRNNHVLADNSAMAIADPFNLTAPNFLPTKNVYLLNGWVYVKNNSTLTIEPGTIIRGDKNNKGALIIEKGSMLNAIGSVNEPIVFTSNQSAGTRAGGDWGGVILCGLAPINVPGGTATIEGGVGSTYGGSNPADNSGTLKYVRIEYAGVAFAPNNEINGLTMGGVGNGTTLDNIQVSYGGDDSFEWFGGTVNAKHLISLAPIDDDFDTDFGYQGMLQFLVLLRDPAIADVSGSNGFESDNNADGNTNEPFTMPVFSNVSMFGCNPSANPSYNTNHKRAMHIRRNSRLNVYNSVFMGSPTGLFLDGTATQAAATAGILKMQYNFMSGMTTNFASTFESDFWNNASNHNTAPYSANSQMMISNPFSLTSPDFMPLTGSPVLQSSYWSRTISGKVIYANSASTALNGVTVELKNASGEVVSSSLTNATGDYSLSAIDGLFTLNVKTSKAWGGVSVADALRLRQYIAGTSTLTAIGQLAGDINQSMTLSVSDALALRQKIAGLAISVSTWLIPDYVFSSLNLTVSGSSLSNQNIQGLCGGDVNASYTPAAK